MRRHGYQGRFKGVAAALDAKMIVRPGKGGPCSRNCEQIAEKLLHPVFAPGGHPQLKLIAKPDGFAQPLGGDHFIAELPHHLKLTSHVGGVIRFKFGEIDMRAVMEEMAQFVIDVGQMEEEPAFQQGYAKETEAGVYLELVL